MGAHTNIQCTRWDSVYPLSLVLWNLLTLFALPVKDDNTVYVRVYVITPYCLSDVQDTVLNIKTDVSFSTLWFPTVRDSLYFTLHEHCCCFFFIECKCSFFVFVLLYLSRCRSLLLISHYLHFCLPIRLDKLNLKTSSSCTVSKLSPRLFIYECVLNY